MSTEFDNSVTAGGAQQYVPITQDQANDTSNVSGATSGVVKDKIENAAIGRGTDGASLSVVNANQPGLPPPNGTGALQPGNGWLDAGNMMAFILIMSEVLKEKLKDSLLEGQTTVATMDSIKETGTAAAEAKYQAKVFEAVKMAISAVVEFGGAAAAGSALKNRASLTKDRMDFENKQKADPTHGMTDQQKQIYEANNVRIQQIDSGRAGGPGSQGGLTTAQERELSKLQNKQAAIRKEVHDHHTTEINQKIAEIDAKLQMNQQLTRAIDSLQQSGFTMGTATEEKKAAILEMYQNMNNQAIQSSKETHGKMEDDIKAAIDIIVDAFRKNAEAFTYRSG